MASGSDRSGSTPLLQAAEGSPSVSYMATTTTTTRLQPPAASAPPGTAAAKDDVDVSTTGIPVRPTARPTQRLPSLPSSHRERAPVSTDEFQSIIASVREAIARGIQPTRIAQGSSGSYFCRNLDGQVVGVFKPKTEEPYAQLNPKWSKWFQRTCCPFFFGRGCLQANVGYISEACASIVDRKLGLGIVPRTEVVHLASPAFHYGRRARRRASTPADLPLKVGSFQLFVKGYKDGTIFLRELSADPLATNLARQFREQFECMVILDYITRNTDRGNDNWLVKVNIEGSPAEPVTPLTNAATATVRAVDDVVASASGASLASASWERVAEPRLYLAAIDNGLSFPFKHPDSWRAYPFAWSFLPAARVPFSAATTERFMDRLSDPEFVADLVDELRAVMERDEDFSERLHKRQMAVMRGQIHNLVEALTRHKSPYDLAQMPAITIDVDGSSQAGFQKRILEFQQQHPWFRTC